MPGITHNEVRRHPRWREELDTPHSSQVQKMPGTRLLGVVAVCIIVTTIAVLLLQG